MCKSKGNGKTKINKLGEEGSSIGDMLQYLEIFKDKRFIPAVYPVLFTAVGWYLNPAKVRPSNITYSGIATLGYFAYTFSIHNLLTGNSSKFIGPKSTFTKILSVVAFSPIYYTCANSNLFEAYYPVILKVAHKCSISSKYDDLVKLAFQAINFAILGKVSGVIKDFSKDKDNSEELLKNIIAEAIGLFIKFYIKEQLGTSWKATAIAVTAKAFTTTILNNFAYTTFSSGPEGNKIKDWRLSSKFELKATADTIIKGCLSDIIENYVTSRIVEPNTFVKNTVSVALSETITKLVTIPLKIATDATPLSFMR